MKLSFTKTCGMLLVMALSGLVMSCEGNQKAQTDSALSDYNVGQWNVGLNTNIYRCKVGGEMTSVHTIENCDNRNNSDFFFTRCQNLWTDQDGEIYQASTYTTSVFAEGGEGCNNAYFVQFDACVAADDDKSDSSQGTDGWAANASLCEEPLPVVTCVNGEKVTDVNECGTLHGEHLFNLYYCGDFAGNMLVANRSEQCPIPPHPGPEGNIIHPPLPGPEGNIIHPPLPSPTDVNGNVPAVFTDGEEKTDARDYFENAVENCPAELAPKTLLDELGATSFGRVLANRSSADNSIVSVTAAIMMHRGSPTTPVFEIGSGTIKTGTNAFGEFICETSHSIDLSINGTVTVDESSSESAESFLTLGEQHCATGPFDLLQESLPAANAFANVRYMRNSDGVAVGLVANAWFIGTTGGAPATMIQEAVTIDIVRDYDTNTPKFSCSLQVPELQQ